MSGLFDITTPGLFINTNLQLFYKKIKNIHITKKKNEYKYVILKKNQKKKISKMLIKKNLFCCCCWFTGCLYKVYLLKCPRNPNSIHGFFFLIIEKFIFSLFQPLRREEINNKKIRKKTIINQQQQNEEEPIIIMIQQHIPIQYDTTFILKNKRNKNKIVYRYLYLYNIFLY